MGRLSPYTQLDGGRVIQRRHSRAHTLAVVFPGDSLLQRTQHKDLCDRAGGHLRRHDHHVVSGFLFLGVYCLGGRRGEREGIPN